MHFEYWGLSNQAIPEMMCPRFIPWMNTEDCKAVITESSPNETQCRYIDRSAGRGPGWKNEQTIHCL